MSTFAVIETGGKQYRVSEGDIITIEKLKGEYSDGDKIVFEDVLMIDDGTKSDIGTPTLSGKKVTGELVESGRAKKISVIRFKSKSRYFKKRGHRQPFMRVKITKVA
jgi:large subunit ribosomal protein L21